MDTTYAEQPEAIASSTSPGTVLVTGGGSGLGQAIAAAVRAAGGRPLVMDLQPDPSDPDSVAVDVSDTAATTQAVRKLAEHAGGIDAVVTAAGTDSCGPLGTVPAQDWERVIQVNLLGTVAVVRAALPYLEQSGGRVVTVASTLGLRVAGDASAYCASKFGIVGFTRALAMELAGRVGVTLLVPGGMQTHFFDNRDEQYKPQDDSKLMRPEHVANSVLHALSAPAGSEVREIVVCHPNENSWP